MSHDKKVKGECCQHKQKIYPTHSTDAGGTVKSHHLRRVTSLVLAVLAILALGPGRAMADAHIGQQLVNRLATALPLQQLEVVVVYKQSGPVQATQVQALQLLGITRGLSFRKLPIVGALATPGAIRQLARRSDVLAIHANSNLSYSNNDARRISGVDDLQADPDYGFTGAGVAVMVNDSGIDATLLVNTAVSMPGRSAFEVGAGHVDAYAAGAAAAGN